MEEAPQRKKKCHVIIIIIARRSIVLSAPLLGRFIIIVRRPLVLSAPPLGRFILHTQTDCRFLAREISFRFVFLRPLS